jgi:hypothetical protein
VRRLITGVIVVNIMNWNRKGKALLSLGAVAVTGVGMFGVTAAASAAPVTGLNFTATVIGVGPGSFTVRRANQPVTVDVSPTTTYRKQGVSSASLSNVLVGERVQVQGSITSNLLVVDADQVQILAMTPNDFDATVSSLGTGNFIAMRGTSPISVDISPQTSFSVGGTVATFSSLADGDRVIVHGTSNPGGSVVNAVQIYILSFGSLQFTATVTQVNSGGFTVRRINAPLTVQVSSKTTYSEHGVSSPSLADVLIGERVTVHATDTASSSVVKATQVQVAALPPMDINATVTQVGAGMLTVLRGNSRVTVDVSAKTQYSQRGVASPSISDIAPGTRIIVHGTSNPGGTVINALHVYIL